MAIQLDSAYINSLRETMNVMELRKAKIKELKKQIDALTFELNQLESSCHHEHAHREEEYAYCNICGKKLGWWGLYIT